MAGRHLGACTDFRWFKLANLQWHHGLVRPQEHKAERWLAPPSAILNVGKLL
jgi:hypothetical protein